MITQHKEFDLETQLQLDRLWDSWSQADKAAANAGYYNEAANGRSDVAWNTYQNALDVAYRTLASAEADEFIKRHKSALVAVVSQWGYWQLSKQLTTQVREVAQ